MDPLQISLMVDQHLSANGARSALPGAPVVPFLEKRPVVPRSRTVLSTALLRLADVVAPTRPAAPPARRRGLRTGAGAH